ncbi:MAG: LacI family DNA-binding transcriptional regulator [Gammaproteobacteria bacterium]
MKSTAKTTIDDVAALAGVSIKTVSRVVNKEPNVREKTKEKVAAAIQQLNYIPNQSARNLASYRSRFIGLIYDDPSTFELPSSGYITRLQEGCLRACRAAQYEVLIHPCNYRGKDVDSELTSLIEQVRPAGMIIAAPLSNMQKIVGAIEATGTPLVRLSSGSNRADEYTVATNDRDISAEMTRYLASLGHKRIAFINGHRQHKAVAQRLLGYKDGLKQSGLPVDDNLIEAGDNSIGSGEVCTTRLLSMKKRPSAIFTANDDMAAGALRVASKMGLRVPEDLSIAGCDDISLCQQVHPMLTTIRQPLASMAERAATALIQSSRGIEFDPGPDIIPAQLKIRESTGPAPD